MAVAGLGETVSGLRQAYESGRTRSLAWRQAQLRGLLRLLKEQEAAAFEALHEDLGKHRAEAYRDEVGLLIKSANEALRQLGKWMTPEKVWVPLVAFPATGQIVPEPLGVILIFSCWNIPSIAGAADRGHRGRERRGAEAVGALAVHGQVPQRQRREVPGRRGRQGRPGRPGGRGAAHGAPVGQGPLHREPARRARRDGRGVEAPDARGAGAGRQVPLHLRHDGQRAGAADRGEPHHRGQVVVLRRPGLPRHRLRARRGALPARPAQGAQVDAEEVLLRHGPHGTHSERAPLREAVQPSERQGGGAVRPARRLHGRQEPVHRAHDTAEPTARLRDHDGGDIWAPAPDHHVEEDRGQHRLRASHAEAARHLRVHRRRRAAAPDRGGDVVGERHLQRRTSAIRDRRAAVRRRGAERIRAVPRQVLVRDVQPQEGGHEARLPHRADAEVPAMERAQGRTDAAPLSLRLLRVRPQFPWAQQMSSNIRHGFSNSK